MLVPDFRNYIHSAVTEDMTYSVYRTWRLPSIEKQKIEIPPAVDLDSLTPVSAGLDCTSRTVVSVDTLCYAVKVDVYARICGNSQAWFSILKKQKRRENTP